MGTELTQHHSPHSDLIEDVIQHASQYDFIAATRLLHAWLNVQHQPSTWPNLKFSAHLSLAFPNADIHEIQSDDGQHFRVIANFLAIYGSTSPLPNYYTEDLLQEAQQENFIARDFLDVFQQRLYESYYDYHIGIHLNTQNPASHRYLEKIYGLAGLGTPAIQASIAPHKLLCYASLLASKHRTYEGLAHLLSDYTHSTVVIEPFTPWSQELPPEQYALLGEQNCQLGEDCHLGQSYTSHRNHLCIRFEDLTETTFTQLLPKQALALTVKELIQLYMLSCLSVRIDLRYCPQWTEHPPAPVPVLGQSAWLGQSETPVQITYPLI